MENPGNKIALDESHTPSSSKVLGTVPMMDTPSALGGEHPQSHDPQRVGISPSQLDSSEVLGLIQVS
jgi:hypothetical protein